MSDGASPQRYFAIYVLLDHGKLSGDTGDLIHAVEGVICHDHVVGHDCPLLAMSAEELTEEQHDLTLEQTAMELRAEGWIVVPPRQRAAAQRVWIAGRTEEYLTAGLDRALAERLAEDDWNNKL